jgi:hypothetical protein
MYRSLIALIATGLATTTAYAESDEEKQSSREHRGTPEVALEACSNSVQGDPCSFEGRNGEALDGSCEAPDDKPLACRPEGGSPKHQLERKQ